MKKILVITSILLVTTALIYLFCKIQLENVLYPASTLVLLAGYTLKLLFNKDAKKHEQFLPIGKAFMYKVNGIGIIIFLVVVTMVVVVGSKSENWMNIPTAVFYGISFVLLSVMVNRPFQFALKKNKIVFDSTLLFYESIKYTNIKEVVICTKDIVFVTHDGNELPFEVRISKKEKATMLNILSKNNVAVIDNVK